MSAYLTIITALGLTFLVYLVFVALSFVEKRRFFVFPEYKAVRFFDRLQKRWKAFLGRNNEGTIYEKENKLFDSLRMGKEPESPIDIYFFYGNRDYYRDYYTLYIGCTIYNNRPTICSLILVSNPTIHIISCA